LKSVFSPRWSFSRLESCCHVAAAPLLDDRQDQQGRIGKSTRRKPAWSLQEREMVEDLGLRSSGSSPPARTRARDSPLRVSGFFAPRGLSGPLHSSLHSDGPGNKPP
jgi:hypothetical protein